MLIESPELRQKIGQYGRKTAETQLSLTASGEKLGNLLLDLVATSELKC
jgi:hypothetical protein